MARWQLMEDHYLPGYPPDLAEDGVEWEYKETDRITGREKRKRFKVPFYMPKESTVCHRGKGLPTDTVFFGDPTPSMTPLDDEAREISGRFTEAWKHPIESLPANGFSEYLLEGLNKKLDALSALSPQPVAQSSVSKEEFEELKAQLAALMAEKLAEKDPSPVKGIRR